ncbi:MAG: ATP-binding protein [Actinomycetota bacterium]
MQILCTLCLPRDEASVPVVRHICRDALLKLGVEDDCVSDIEIAVTEACSNVLHHAADTEAEYEVSIEIDALECEIRIKDTGGEAFDGSDHELSSETAESGRGIFLMNALVDELKFLSEPEAGTIVHLVKRLSVPDDAPLKILADASTSGSITIDTMTADGRSFDGSRPAP